MSFDYRLRRGPFDLPPGPDAEVGGGVQMLGPYRVNFDDPDIEDPGTLVAIGVLPVGSVIIRGSVMIVTPIVVPAGPPQVMLHVGTAGSIKTLFSTLEDASPELVTQLEMVFDTTFFGGPPPVVLVKSLSNIYCQMVDSDDALTAPTEGACDVYVFYVAGAS